MNFLAHAYLAGTSPPLIVGGVAGDWVKGLLPGALPADLARGVSLHRAIDTHAETHPAFQRSRQRISAARRRYAGVMVDIFYDHLLAIHWAELHRQPLGDYCLRVYEHMALRLTALPASAQNALRLMAEENWLLSYRERAGIANVLHRMSRRARQPNPLQGGEAEFAADPAGFHADFRAWIGDANQFAEQWIRNHPPRDTTQTPNA